MNKETLIEFGDITLTDGTKKYIEAYKLANIAAFTANEELFEFWGVDHVERTKMNDKLFERLKYFKVKYYA